MEQAKLKIDQTIDLSTLNRKIVIKPITTQSARLATLLADITPDNRHSEISFGESVGKESL